MWYKTKRRVKAFHYAFEGLAYVMKTQPNFRFHFVVAIFCILLGTVLNLTPEQWAIGLICISFMLILEMANTAFEVVVDHLWQEEHPKAKIIKDVSAGFVLAAAITVFLVGCIVFLPKLYAFIVSLQLG